MIETSLASVTFRGIGAEDVIRLASQAGLHAIEWGGDVHAPSGNLPRAQRIGEMTRSAGLKISAYGSYYRVGARPQEDFDKTLATAMALGADTIRVWAGDRGSALADAHWLEQVQQGLRSIVEKAQAQGLRIATEYHANTLTDTLPGTQALLAAVPGLYTLWQPPVGRPEQENHLALSLLAPRLANLHVYQLDGCGVSRPLAEGEKAWRSYLQQAACCPGLHYATIEFVQNDSPEQFLQDAEALRAWVAQLEQ